MAAFLMPLNAQGQDALSVLPTPTGLNDEVTLTIDVSKSEENALKAILEANPELPVYIWTWSPSDPWGKWKLGQQQRNHVAHEAERLGVHLDLHPHPILQQCRLVVFQRHFMFGKLKMAERLPVLKIWAKPKQRTSTSPFSQAL